MSNHNPLYDPRPGDVVIFGPQWQRERYEVAEGTEGFVVKYRMWPLRRIFSITLRKWREWARGGEVVEVAGEVRNG